MNLQYTTAYLNGIIKQTAYILIVLLLLSVTVVAKSANSAEMYITDELSNRNAILLQNAQFDTSLPQPTVAAVSSVDMLSISQYPADVEGYYIVQFSGYIQEEWKQAVRDTGAAIFDYVPNNAFVVRMNSSVKSQVESLNMVQWVGIYHPSYRISPALSATTATAKSITTQEATATGDVAYEDIIVLLFDTNDNARVLSDIENLGGEIVDNAGDIIRVRIDGAKIGDIAVINGVSWIEKYVQPVIFNDVAAGIMNVDDVRNTHGLTGAGQIVAVADTGLDTGANDATMHDDIEGRILAIRDRWDGAADLYSGHGTHVVGSILGNGSHSAGQFKGMAPQAQLVFQAIGGVDDVLYLIGGLNPLFQQAYNDGARIHSDSWGSDVSGEYTSSSQETDQFAWNNKDIVLIFSAGNNGSAGINTVGSPGTAKNTITVGASESSRVGGSIDAIASFSSRGPTDDGRIKPDIVAPGKWIISTRSSVSIPGELWGDYDDYYRYSSGTSMATPLTAGTAALVRQYYVDNKSISPSAALIKATLINSAANLSISPNDQGWGRVDIEKSLFPTSPRAMRYHDNISLNTSGSWNVSYYINDSSESLKITLVWTDYEGNPAVIPQLVNNLDMDVTGPSGSYLGNGGDSVNNVEQVELSPPSVGLYTIQINGTNIPQGPQPFALVISGAINSAPIIISSNATPVTIEANGTDNTTFNVTATDPDGITSVTMNLTTIGGSTAQTLVNNSGIWQYTTNTTALGTFYLPVNVTDTIGSSNTLVNITLNTVDTTPPTSSAPSNTNFSANTTANFTNWVLTDLHPGYYWILRNDTRIVSPTNWTSGANITVPINTTIGLGDFNYTIQYNDSLGNNGTQDIVIITINDTTPPYASDENPADGTSLFNTTPQISVNITDNASGVNPASIVMTVNGSIVSPTISPISGGYNVSNLTIAPFTYTQLVTVTVNATDNNTNPLNHSWSFTVDGNAPNITTPIATPPTIESNGTDTTNLSVIVEDDLSGIANVTINLTTIGGSSVAEMTNTSGTYWIITNATGVGNGTFYLPVNATDNAGNSNTSVNITLYINDTTPPIFSNYIPLTGTSDLTPTISINATDRGSGINASSINMTTNETQVIPTNTNSGFTYNFTNTTPASTPYSHGDTINVTFNISDNAGHTNNTSWMFYIDNVTPTINITSPTNAYSTTESSVPVSGTVNGTGSPPTVTVNGITATTTINTTTFNGTFTASASISVGSNIIYANVTDAAGNTNSINISVTRTSTYTPSSGGGGGGGGGGGSNEPTANIEINQVEYVPNVLKDSTTDFSFTDLQTPVSGISFYTLMTPSREVEIRVQQLYNRSASTTIDPPGTVYRHLNIICSLATPKEIKDAKIKFKVTNEWMVDNGVATPDVILYRWHDDKWNALITENTGSDSSFTYYTSDTPGFSPFEISTVSAPAPIMDISSTSVASAQEPEEEVPDGDASDEDNGGAGAGRFTSGWMWAIILLVVATIGVAYVYWKKKVTQEDGDGKR